MNLVRIVGSRWTSRALWLLVGLFAVLTLVNLMTVWRASNQMKAIDAARAGEPLGENASPAQKIASAVFLSTQDESEKALELYQDVESANSSRPEILRIARFNSANQYMRDGQKLLDTDTPGRAVPLIELAKQTYRGLLIDDPSNWAARYNLARALALMPDPPPDDKPSGPAPDAERAITTMRGYSPGMP